MPNASRIKVFAVRAIALLILIVMMAFVGRVWLKSAFSCVRMVETMEYTDEDERERLLPWYTSVPAPEGFSDSAYDREFPDLVEPTLSP
ncbi:MAG: hypothetical protein IJO53_00890 [Clostridia bacterium]|nr:hypothetical protein [Clostridia bacterium]